MKTILIRLTAGLCLLLGLATVWTPIPTGVPLIAFGIFLVIATSRPAARRLRRARQANGRLDGALRWVEDRTGGRFARVLKRTRPRRPPAAPGFE